MEGADVVTPRRRHPCQLTHQCRPPDPLHFRKNTQKSKFLLSQTLKWKKNMFFVIPEMPSKTFVMVLKKLPDHFKASVIILKDVFNKTLFIIGDFKVLESKLTLVYPSVPHDLF